MLRENLNSSNLKGTNITKSLPRKVVKFYFLPNISDLPFQVWKFGMEVAMEKVTFMCITKVLIVKFEMGWWHSHFIFGNNILRDMIQLCSWMKDIKDAFDSIYLHVGIWIIILYWTYGNIIIRTLMIIILFLFLLCRVVKMCVEKCLVMIVLFRISSRTPKNNLLQDILPFNTVIKIYFALSIISRVFVLMSLILSSSLGALYSMKIGYQSHDL